MKKFQYIIYVVIVAVAVATLSIVFNCFSRPSYSELENRELSKCPTFSWEALFSGKLTKDISAWYSDSEPYRDSFMTLSMEFDKAKRLNITTKGEEEVNFIAGDSNDEQASEVNTAADIAEESPVEVADTIPAQPKAEEKAKIANHGIVLVGSEPNVRALMAYKGGALHRCQPG